MQGFTFSVSDVLDCLNVEHPGSGGCDAADLTCPVCGGRKKLHVVYSKNLAHCNKCGAGGGMLQLAADVLQTDRSKAAKRIAEMLGQSPASFYHPEGRLPAGAKGQPMPKGMERHKAPTAGIETRDKAYQSYLGMLILSGYHMQGLKKRGLNEGQIQAFGYKSVPLMGKEIYPEQLLKQGIDLRGVPGFYQKRGAWNANIGWQKGFYIPVRDIRGRILGMQIRLDDVPGNAAKGIRKSRYIWVSSWSDSYLMDCGSNLKGIPKLHHVGFPLEGDIPVIGLTEGPLKADIAHSLGYPYPMVALCGLSNLHGFPEELKFLKEYRGLKEVQDLTDMDKFRPDVLQGDGTMRINHVRRLCDGIAAKVDELGLLCRRFRWEMEYKGIDDYLLMKLNGRRRA